MLIALVVVIAAIASYGVRPDAPALAVSSAAVPAIMRNIPETRPLAPRLPSVLVEPDWVSARLGDPALILLDTRPAARYAGGHIPAAVNLDVATIQAVKSNKIRYLAAPEIVCKLLGEAGIDPATTVVVYDDGEDYVRAAYLFMALEAMGHQSAAVLDGGYRTWVVAGADRPTSTQATRRPAATFPVVRHPVKRLATKATVLQAIGDPDSLIIDSRSPDEFRGDKSEAARAGHIPSALNLEAVDALSGDSALCRFKSPDDLLEQYFAVAPEKRIIVYCNSGRRASVNYLALRILGRDVSVYDGGWLEWASDQALPIQTDDVAKPVGNSIR